MKPAFFHPRTRDVLRTFPEEIKKELGKAILDLQKGQTLSMPLSRPMPAVAPGVEELRLQDRSGIYRAFYLKKAARGVFVFHTFMKKTQKTPCKILPLGRSA